MTGKPESTGPRRRALAAVEEGLVAGLRRVGLGGDGDGDPAALKRRSIGGGVPQRAGLRYASRRMEAHARTILA